MENFIIPSEDDLRAYRVLIDFLQQVRSLVQDVNAEAERFNKSLREQKAELERQSCCLEDFSSSLSDYEDDVNRLNELIKDRALLLEGQRKEFDDISRSEGQRHPS